MISLAIASGIALFGIFFILIYPEANELVFDRLVLLIWAIALYKIGATGKTDIKQYAAMCYLFFHVCTAHLVFTISRNHLDGFYLFSLLIAVQVFAFSFREEIHVRRYHLLHTSLLIVVVLAEGNMSNYQKGLYAGAICVVSCLQFQAAKMKIRFLGQINMKEHMLRALFSKSENAVFMTDMNGSIIEVNPRVQELFGFEKSELLGCDFKMLRCFPLSDEELERGLIELETNRYWTTESCLRKKDGSEFPARVSLTLIKGNYGSCLVYRVLDITSIKEHEQRLIEARNKAEEAVAVKSQFLAIMSHEIRTPLNGVIATTALLQQTDLNTQQEEYANTIGKSGKSLLMLINDILEYSKMESGKMELCLQPEVLDDAIYDVVDLLRPHAESKGIKLIAEVDHTINGFALTDVNRLKQVLFNLIGNAIKFTNEGFVSVSMKRIAMNHGRTSIHFEVSDTGIGIPQDKFHRLFRSFSQIDSTVSKKYGGTGLGLAISKQIIELMGGNIEVESTLGKGTTFSFDLTFDHLTHEMINRIDVESKESVSFDYSKIRLLIAEDNEINRQVLVFILENLKVHFDFAENGQEAIEKLRNNNYDMFFTDLNMPVMDGFEATHIIRSDLRLQLPVIAISAISFEDEKQRCHDVGMNDFLPKPFELESLKLMLRKWSERGNESVVAA
jgi:PAS domain S-box-containing protein